VPQEQIGFFLGHIPKGNDASTATYAPMEPEYCDDALAVIESVMTEVQRRLTIPVFLNDPAGVSEYLLKCRHPCGKLSDFDKQQIFELIRAGHSAPDIAHRFGVSLTAVYWYRNKPTELN
jgi:hypothetical protein